MNLEPELKNALHRVPAPEGFAERVLARVRGEQTIVSARQTRVSVVHRWRAVAATFLLAVILGGWGTHEMIERRREGERAREQVLLALRITGEKLANAQRGVSHITR